MVSDKQGHAPGKTSSSKNPHGSQLLWAPASPKAAGDGTAYYEKEGATPHPGARKDSLQYDGRADGCIGVRVGKWNLGSLNEKGEVCEEPRKRMIDECCSQDVRWRRQGARMLVMKGRRCKL